jgi:hypothetical protein
MTNTIEQDVAYPNAKAVAGMNGQITLVEKAENVYLVDEDRIKKLEEAVEKLQAEVLKLQDD